MYDNHFQFKAMDTEIEIAGFGRMNNHSWQKQVEYWFDQFENICSRFRTNSELSQLNQMPTNTVIQLHPILYEILKKAVDYADQTHYYFNPFLGSALKAYGYHKTFAEIKDEWNSQFELVSYHYENVPSDPIEFLPMLPGVIKKVDQEIDLGGIAKGWSVDKVAEIVKEDFSLHSGIVNAGGDLFVWGNQELTIGISHPILSNCEKDIIQFTMCNGAVATSNTLYRSWVVGQAKEKVHHIFDGTKGQPTQSDIVQATVFSTSAAEADVLAKVLCMHNFNDAVSWLTKEFPHTGCIVIRNDGQVAISKSIKNYVTRLVM